MQSYRITMVDDIHRVDIRWRFNVLARCWSIIDIKKPQLTLTFPSPGTTCVVIPIMAFTLVRPCFGCTVGVNITVMRASDTVVNFIFWKKI